MIRFVTIALSMLPVAPGIAHADWVHNPTGLRVPDRVGADLAKGETRDVSDGKQANIWVQYGTPGEDTTLYVYRSAHPDAGLWFERTVAAMRGNVGLAGDVPPPVPVAMFGATAPNALRQIYTLGENGKGYRSTALLLVNHGDWLMKVRLSSRTLDPEALGQRLDRFVAAMQVKPAEPNPLAKIADCTAPPPAAATATATATPVADQHEKMRVLVEGGMTAQMAARGKSGPAADDAGWCREPNDGLAPIASVYRVNAGDDWVMLIGDSGVAAATGHSVLPGKPVLSGLFLQTPERTALIEAFDRNPGVDAAVSGYIGPVVSGQRQPIASIESDAKKR